MKMLDYLRQISAEHVEIQAKLVDEEVLADQKLLVELSKRFSALDKTIEPVNKFLRLTDSVTEMQELIEANEDEELVEMAKEELPEVQAQIESMKEGLEEQLFEQDSEPDRNLFIEIRPAAGGQESALFSGELYKMYTRFAANQGWKVDVISEQTTEIGGYKYICFGVSGEGAYMHYKYESGVHRVQRVPETESGGRVHTSTVTVAVMKEPDEVEISIEPADLKIDTYRASGAGGQHLNTTDSAVRITHVPTGVVVTCQDERSQTKNKEKAMRILKAKIHDEMQQKHAQGEADARKAQVGTGDRSEKIRTYNFPQRRVTDHRGPITIFQLEEVLTGELDLIVKQLMKAERQMRIQW